MSTAAVEPRSVLVLAHQGGWDELALLLVPIGILGLLLWLANRRLEQAEMQRNHESEK